MNLPVLGTSYKWNHTVFFFCLWFISLRLFSSFIHVTACVLSKTSIELCHILLLCSLVSRPLGLFSSFGSCGCCCHELCYAVCALSRLVLSDSLWLHGLQPARLVCPWWFSRQSGLPCPPPGDLLNPGIEPRCVLHCRWIGFFTRRIPEPPGKLWALVHRYLFKSLLLIILGIYP